MKRMCVAIVYGGPSPEHEVSIMSARSVARALDPRRYRVLMIKIPRSRLALPRSVRQADVIFPLGHGLFMEDGRLQAMLDALGRPYVGSGLLASALAMDKHVSKSLFASAGLPIVKYVAMRRNDEPTAARRLRLPVFVKPSNGGSSIGMTKVGEWRSLPAALRLAWRYDDVALVEAAVPNAREIEIAVIGNENPRASVPGEIIPAGEYYDYRAKYFDKKTRLIIPAPLPATLRRRMTTAAIRAYQSLGCRGFARVDFLLARKTGKFVVSEINTIPGFTATSMFPKLWEASGLPYSKLLDRLIALAERA